MCEYCGCKGVPAIAELMDEHAHLVEHANAVRQALNDGDRSAAFSSLTGLIGHLDVHVRREESGLFRAMRGAGEFADEVEQLEEEHRDLDWAIAELDPDALYFPVIAKKLLDDLDEHIEREELGIFPVSVVTLGARGWRAVEEAHDALPTFLETMRRPA